MIFKPATWYRIAVGLSVLNLIAGGYALGAAEPMHAAIHGVLAIGFGLWARRLRNRGEGATDAQNEALDAEARVEALEADLNSLRKELSETQERLDFAERMLARGPDKGRVDQQR